MSSTSTNLTIVKDVTIDAPAAKVFAALTEPDQLTQWWGSDEIYRVTHMERDLRVGGTWRTTGRGADGHTFAVEGVYRAIEPPRLLEYTWNYDWDEHRAETVVRFELTERAGSTHVHVTHSGFLERAAHDQHEQGWDLVLGWLTRFVERP